MARFFASGVTTTALGNGNAIVAISPNASVVFKLRRVVIGVVTSGVAVSDFDFAVAINRGTARGTSSATATINKLDPLSAAAGINAVDTGWSVQPTLAATDAYTYGFNSRGGIDQSFGAEAGAADFVSTTGTANVIAIVNRAGAALPASHAYTWSVEWEE